MTLPKPKRSVRLRRRVCDCGQEVRCPVAAGVHCGVGDDSCGAGAFQPEGSNPARPGPVQGASLVECFIGKAKCYRQVFTRFEELSRRYLGFWHFAAALIWLR